jgi:hypothetical protein
VVEKYQIRKRMSMRLEKGNFNWMGEMRIFGENVD